MAMRHCEAATHQRAKEAAHLLVDRQLPTGGANYGNTFVLGQMLRPHILPSAMSMVALHNVRPVPRKLRPTLRYLQDEINRPIAALSLAWTIHALSSAEAVSNSALRLEFEWPLREAIKRLIGKRNNAHRENLLLLASQGSKSDLLRMPALDAQSILPSAALGDTDEVRS